MKKIGLSIDDSVNLEEMESKEAHEYSHPYQNLANDDAFVVESDQQQILGSDDPEYSGTDVNFVGGGASVNSDRVAKKPDTPIVTRRIVASVAILFLVNLLNYTDRFTIAGVLPQIKNYYGSDGSPLNNADAGLLQTSFILFYMIFSPIFGFLGDRTNRTILMTGGILAWSAVTLASSFVPSNMFWLFVVMRGLVGIGEASYSTLAPTIIADMLVGNNRTRALTVFYFAIPVGSGFGYIVASALYQATGQWQYALRFTPALGVICALCIFFLVKEPVRGGADGGVILHSSMSLSSWWADVKYLLRNKSYMLSTWGFVCVAFCAGALAFWAPTFIDSANVIFGYGLSSSTISLLFGVITCIAGVVGVLTGTESARRLRPYVDSADPLVCAFGLITAAPFLFFGLYMSQYHINATWVLIFIGSTLLCLNWALATDMLLYVTVPNRRSTAEAFQILTGHTFGDAGSPWFVGLVSDAIKHGNNSAIENYYSLQYALYMMSFVAALGGGFYLFTAIFIKEDREAAYNAIHVGSQLGNAADESETDYRHSNSNHHGNSIQT